MEKFFGEKANFLLGVVYILIVLFLPYGIIGTWYMKSFQIRSGWQRLLGFMRKKKV